MKKQLLLLVMMLLPMVATAQNSEPKYIEETLEVTDTAKAMQMAELKREELKEQIEEDKAKVENESKYIVLLSYSKKKKVKKEEEKDMLCDIVDRCVRYEKTCKNVAFFENVFSDKAETVKENVQLGKVDPVFWEETSKIINYLHFSVLQEKEVDKMDYTELVNPLPTKTIKVKKPNPNFAYRWLVYYDKEKLTFNPLKNAYTTPDYPQYLFKACDMEFYETVWALFDKSGNLISTEMGVDADKAREAIVDACVIYDYNHNAYDINSESQSLKDCVKAIIQGEIPLNDNYLAGNLLQSQLMKSMARESLKSGLISLKEYQEIINGTREAINKMQDEMRKKMAQYDEETLTKARRYVQTLRDNNSKLIHRGNGIQRNAPLEAIVDFDKLSVRELYSYDKDENKIICKFEVINK